VSSLELFLGNWATFADPPTCVRSSYPTTGPPGKEIGGEADGGFSGDSIEHIPTDKGLVKPLIYSSLIPSGVWIEPLPDTNGESG